MDKQAGQVAEISLTRMKISAYKHSQAGWPGCRDESPKMPSQVIFNNCQNNVKITKCSHINTREIHSAYWTVSVRGPARLPINRPLVTYSLVQRNLESFDVCVDIYLSSSVFCRLLLCLNILKINNL
jgi:hypothetical protein